MNRLSLRNNRLTFKTAGKSPTIIIEQFLEYTPTQQRKTGGCQHVTGWTCKHLGSQPVVPTKNLPDHCRRTLRLTGLISAPISWHVTWRMQRNSTILTRNVHGLLTNPHVEPFQRRHAPCQSLSHLYTSFKSPPNSPHSSCIPNPNCSSVSIHIIPPCSGICIVVVGVGVVVGVR